MIDAFLNILKDGPPENLTKLFSMTKKSEAMKFCHKITLRYADLSKMILGCGSLGYLHTPIFEDNDVSHLWKGAREKVQTPNGLRQLHKQLRQDSSRSIFHFFVRDGDPDIWHLLTADSCDSRDDCQFVQGSHVHFINHLWVRPTIQEIISVIPRRPRGVHIRTTDE